MTNGKSPPYGRVAGGSVKIGTDIPALVPDKCCVIHSLSPVISEVLHTDKRSARVVCVFGGNSRSGTSVP